MADVMTDADALRLVTLLADRTRRQFYSWRGTDADGYQTPVYRDFTAALERDYADDLCPWRLVVRDNLWPATPVAVVADRDVAGALQRVLLPAVRDDAAGRAASVLRGILGDMERTNG